VCCFSLLLPYVAVTGDDYARLGDDAAGCVSFDGNRAYMRMADGRCASLVLGEGRFLCAVYEGRPDTCRDLLRDSSACEGEIASKGERPLLALGRKHRA
jgi:Fe-S-cluster containining protein